MAGEVEGAADHHSGALRRGRRGGNEVSGPRQCGFDARGGLGFETTDRLRAVSASARARAGPRERREWAPSPRGAPSPRNGREEAGGILQAHHADDEVTRLGRALLQIGERLREARPAAGLWPPSSHSSEPGLSSAGSGP